MACAMDLALGKPTMKYAPIAEQREMPLKKYRFVEYSMNRVRMLIHFGVTPYVVFDGDYLPSKFLTETERALRREESRKLGLELHRLGKLSHAHLELQKAVDVTPEMAGQFIEELKKLGVKYLVAPYEADAQLAYLERKDIIQGILSEDSDLLVFGVQCLLTKLDQFGDCIEINRKDFTACKDISLIGWSDAEFRLMAILSGCDYLTNIKHMGLKTAYRLIRKHRTIEKILQMLAFDNKYQVPHGYLESFRKANLTFLHQRVFCPIVNDIVMITSLGDEPEPEDFTYVGGSMDQDIAIGVSRGELHPMTKKPMILKSETTTNAPKTPWQGMQLKPGTPFSNIKGNKSIEEFFKAKRAPLAELDPNSFTPSPSQERLLQQGSRSWNSRAAPSRVLLPQASVLTPSAISVGATNLPGTIIGSSESLSILHLSKRRRLCSENEIEESSTEPTTNAASGRSRFFGTSLPRLSPSIKDKKDKRRGTDTKINLWSDDSIEDVLAGLPDVSDSNGSIRKGKMQIFRDEDQDIVGSSSPSVIKYDSTSLVDSQTSSISKVSTDPNSSVSTAVTSVTSTAGSVAKTLSENSRLELAALGNRFSYQPARQERKLTQSGNMGSMPRESHLTNHPVSKPHLIRQGSMTPLQRLGAGALNRSQSCSGLPNVASSLSVRPQPNSNPQDIQSTTPEVEKEATRVRGSEDLIVPDSEEDSDAGFSVSEAEEHEKPKLNLGRFAFAG